MDILKYIHSSGLIYHDMKPDNICIGNTNETENKIYLIGKQMIIIPGVKFSIYQTLFDRFCIQ